MKRRLKQNVELCTKLKMKSIPEKEVYEYIKYIYNDIIIRNDNKILNGKELDIYLPKLNLAFEVNGDFWHLNPELYDDSYNYHGRTVESEKERRNEKNILSNNKGIELVHIWQYDWNNRKRKTKKLIRNAIINKLKNNIYK